MTEDRKFRQIWFLLLMTALIAAFSLSTAFASGMMLPLVFILTVLLTVFIIKSGFVRAMAAPVVSLLLVFAVTGNILLALSIVFSYLLTAVVLSLCLYRRLPISKTVILTSLCYLVFLFLSLYLASAQENMSIPDFLYREIHAATELWMQTVMAAASASQTAEASELIAQLQQNIAPIADAIFQMFPSAMMIVCAGWGYLVVVLVKTVLKRMGTDVTFLKNFREMRLDMPFSILMVLTILASFFFQDGMISVVLSNLLVLFTLLLGFCGLTILDYFMIRKGIVRPLRIMILIVVLLLASFIGIVGYLLILLGLLDSSMNFRKRMNKGDGEDGQTKIS